MASPEAKCSCHGASRAATIATATKAAARAARVARQRRRAGRRAGPAAAPLQRRVVRRLRGRRARHALRHGAGRRRARRRRVRRAVLQRGRVRRRRGRCDGHGEHEARRGPKKKQTCKTFRAVQKKSLGRCAKHIAATVNLGHFANDCSGTDVSQRRLAARWSRSGSGATTRPRTARGRPSARSRRASTGCSCGFTLVV